ncbi:hypothetical protein KC19_3G052900 [Ceratodon purpureus]|uniref:Uncharacterized protein n=1 Tax=Ceratodon purpureus TaxID=3225 RepID=A0A8T0IIQ5_CERPU|nr:hypothetical protein KC19_3G052900 [Ceratodon purpureus]
MPLSLQHFEHKETQISDRTSADPISCKRCDICTNPAPADMTVFGPAFPRGDDSTRQRSSPSILHTSNERTSTPTHHIITSQGIKHSTEKNAPNMLHSTANHNTHLSHSTQQFGNTPLPNP